MKKVAIISLITFVALIPNVYAQTPSVTTSPTVSASPTATPLPSDSPTPSLSPSPTPTQRIETATIRIEVGTQSPWTKRIPVTAYVTPHLSASKMEVSWQKKAGLAATPTTQLFSNVQAETTYTVQFTITPQGTSYQRAITQVILTTATQNFVSSQQIEINLDKDKIITPQSSTYKLYVMLMYASIAIVFLLVVPFTLYKLYKYLKTTIFPKWYAKTMERPQ